MFTAPRANSFGYTPNSHKITVYYEEAREDVLQSPQTTFKPTIVKINKADPLYDNLTGTKPSLKRIINQKLGKNIVQSNLDGSNTDSSFTELVFESLRNSSESSRKQIFKDIFLFYR